MEEILASIRRIISDDEAKPAAAAAIPASKPEPQKAAEAERAAPPAAKPVMAGIPPSKIAAARHAPGAAPAAVVKNGQDEIDAMMAGFDGDAPRARAGDTVPEEEVFELTEQMAMPEMPRPSFQKVEPDDDLEFTDTPAPAPHRAPPIEAAAYDEPAFSAASLPRADMLSTSTVSAVESAFNALATTVLSNNARTLEDLVKEMLRPMLKSWLDDNLPNLVERIVKAEIERVSRGR